MMGGGLLRRRVVSPLQFLILIRLKHGPEYGYKMLKEIRAEFQGLWDIKTGTFYPALRSLESRGFVETETREDTDYYILTEKGNSLLDSIGSRMVSEYDVMQRYFDTVVKWLPMSFLETIIKIVQRISIRKFDRTELLTKMLNHMSMENKVEFLDNLRMSIRNNLEYVEKVYKEVLDGE
jgi:DNA-binding PadR family transcriptional regulator